MLKLLYNVLNEHDLLHIAPIKDLPKSCCKHSSFPVADFDKLKETFIKVLGKGMSPKSADGLVIDVVENQVVFIEMKDLSNFITALKATTTNREEVAKRMEQEFIRYRADQKMIDSFCLLLDVCRHYAIDTSFYPYFVSDACTKKFLFVVGMTSRDFVRFRLSILPFIYKYEYWLLGRADFIAASNFNAI